MSKRKKTLLFIIVIMIVVAAAIFIFRNELYQLFFRPTESSISTGTTQPSEGTVETVAKNLITPWGIAFLPGGDMLVTERPGNLQRIGTNGRSYEIDGVTETSEGGLLGIVLHPDFRENNSLYLYSTYSRDGVTLNRVERYTLLNDQLTFDSTIIENIPGSSTHDGGALAFGPDEKLYITTGDAGNPNTAQDTNALSGKILRLNDDGTVPSDNPFSNAVYSYGHRNPQGIAWDDQGRMWSSEHGPSGPDTGRDEINRIEKGANYGWPLVTGDEAREGMTAPVVQSGDSETWAPGAISFIDGSLYFTGLRAQSLYQAKINDDGSLSLLRHFSEEFGRLRASFVHDNRLYISTSNTDGRGQVRNEDDKVLKIDTGAL